jgi:hypothetical protein
MNFDLNEKCWDVYCEDAIFAVGYQLNLHLHKTFDSAINSIDVFNFSCTNLILVQVDKNDRIIKVIPIKDAIRIQKLNQL